MAEILIMGMEMPKEVNHPLFIRISSDGHIAKGDFLNGGFIETEAKAIEVPPHGELCDKDKLKEEAGGTYQWSQAIEAIKNAPVILEATE